jgi:hypothetical protein
MIFSIPTDKLSMKDSKGMNKLAKNLMFSHEELSRFRFISWQKFEQIFDTKKSLGWLKKAKDHIKLVNHASRHKFNLMKEQRNGDAKSAQESQVDSSRSTALAYHFE